MVTPLIECAPPPQKKHRTVARFLWSEDVKTIYIYGKMATTL